MKKLFFAFAWLLFAIGFTFSSIAIYQVLFNQKTTKNPDEINLISPIVATSSFGTISIEDNGSVKGVKTILEADDARLGIIKNFLDRYDSPLTPHDHFAEVFVGIADKYGIDFRLLPAIAMQESNLCKNIPEGSFNCLGFGIHERGTLTFDSFESNFDRAAKELKANYIDPGRITPEDIMQKYTPSSDGSWANSVNQWMAEMRYDDRQLGRELKNNANVLEFAKESETIEDN